MEEGREKILFEEWVVRIVSNANCANEQLNKIYFSFDSEIQRAEFERRIAIFTPCGISDSIRPSIFYFREENKFFYLSTASNYSLHNKKEVQALIAKQGFKWLEFAQEIHRVIFEKILPAIKITRRDILYPEFAEMEKEINELKEGFLKFLREAGSLTVTGDTKGYLNDLTIDEKVIGFGPDGVADSLKILFKDKYHRIIDLEKEIGELKNKLAEMEKEIEQTKIILKGYESSADAWKARTEELQTQLAEKEKELEHLKFRGACTESAINDAVFSIWNTRSIFGKLHSKRLEKIRKDLMGVLPTETQIKLYKQMGFGPPKPPPEPWPEPPEKKSVIIGYQPKSDDLDPEDPPKGGTGLK